MTLLFILSCWAIIYGLATLWGNGTPEASTVGIVGIFVWHLGIGVLGPGGSREHRR